MEPMNALDRGLQQKIILLENLLSRVAAVRKHLKDNSELVKHQIGDLFVREEQVLRNREQSLLSQLDTIIHVKDEILSQQQDHLHETLGACRQGLECLAATKDELKKSGNLSSSASTMETQISDLFKRLSGIDMEPRESPHVYFEVNPYPLRKAVQSLGLLSFNDFSKRCSQSLPTGIEEYDDESNSLMSKPVQVSARSATVQVCPPQLNVDHEMWLFKEALTSKASDEYDCECAEEKESPCSGFQSSRSNVSNGSGGGRGSQQLNHWLYQIKNQVETEPMIFEDFEIVGSKNSHSCKTSDSIEFLGVSSACSSPQSAEVLKQFHDIATSPPNRWLLTPKEGLKGQKVNFQIFQDVKDECIDKWLIPEVWPTSQEPQTMEPDSEVSDLESICCGGCLTAGVCRAERPCSRFEDCMFENNCGEVAFRKWLMRRGSDPSACDPVLFDRVREAIWSGALDKWLSKGFSDSASEPGTASVPESPKRIMKHQQSNVSCDILHEPLAKLQKLSINPKLETHLRSSQEEVQDTVGFKKVWRLTHGASDSDWLAKPTDVQSEEHPHQRRMSGMSQFSEPVDLSRWLLGR